MALAKKLIFMGPTATVRAKELERYTSFWENVALSKKTDAKNLSSSSELLTSIEPYVRLPWARHDFGLRRFVHEGKPCLNDHLLRIINATCCYEATDPRDHIFALQGLTTIVIQPDYSKSVHEVYCHFAKICVTHLRLDKLLGFSGIGFSFPNTLALPSWVPDWHKYTQQRAGHTVFDSEFAVANSDVDCYFPTAPRVSTTGFLTVSGCICDRVLEIGPPTSDYCDDEGANYEHQLFPFIRNYLSHNGTKGHPMGVPKLQVVFRTMLRDSYSVPKHERLDLDRISSSYLVLTTLYLLSKNSEFQPPVVPTLQSGMERLGLPPNSSLKDFLLACGISIDEKLIGDDFVASYVWRKTLKTHYYMAAVDLCFRLFITKEGYLGWAPPGTRQDDLLCVVGNCSYPVVLRKVNGSFLHVGLCYVLGLMYGEVAKMIKNGKLQIEEFEIQ
jgi:hypothetical protein